MTQISTVAVLALALAGLSGGASVVHAQVQVDAGLANKGKRLFTERGCAGCHTIGKGKRAGPDLLGVTERRDVTWIRRLLKDPDRMLAEDSIAMALLMEYNNQRMKIPRLGDQEVEALIHYLAQQSQRSGS